MAVHRLRRLAKRPAARHQLCCGLALQRRQLGRTAKADAAGLGRAAAGARAFMDQLSLQLGNAAKRRQHEPALRCRRVRPRIAKGAKARPRRVQCLGYVEQIARGPDKPVQARHHQNIIFAKLIEQPGQFRPVAFRARHLFLEDLAAARLLQGGSLKPQVLVPRGDARITDQHVANV